ncbi:hypothetical protein A5821_003165 [Enterococcus sp. 7F3_DIV0205]|uniref:Serine acetyltransferase n=1 Tax=Candidatus Enterococcus palustris TaxID=1834189 RepID=A0AAQ3WB84_9ENTE|nr:serine acetyltransferase [Enterococcus sp. 7F3_DIV0205]OTN83599.1 hypothetical protein A5821_003522 [Enterococcus sp. 7F3_DIV0205]
MESRKAEILHCDVFRYFGQYKIGLFKYLIMPRQVKYFILFRKYQTVSNKYLKCLYKIQAKLLGRKIQMDIPLETKIGRGIVMYHEGQVAIHPDATIGKNVTISPGLVVGHSPRGKTKGVPTIGDNVWLGQNVAVVGKITVGKNVLIAPNSFVNVNIPDNSIVFGNPCVIKKSLNATDGYIKNKV